MSLIPIADVVGGLVKGVAGPGFDAWARTRESNAVIHKVDAETARDITIADYQEERRFGELKFLMSQADRTDPKTSWIRPSAASIAIYVFACIAMSTMQPRLAALFWIDPRPLPPVWSILVLGILGAIFGLRPGEKKARQETVTKAHASIVQAQIGAMKREDSM